MCRQTTCSICKKQTWTGCGQHKDAVMHGIAPDQRCKCTDADKAAGKKRGFLSRLFG